MRIVRLHRPHPRRKGTALAVMGLGILGLAALSTALVYVSHGRANEQQGEQRRIQAEYVCQAGLSQAMYQLQRGQSGNVGSKAVPAAWAGSRFWVEAANVTPSIVRLTASGIDDRSGASQELTVRAVPTTIWNYGAFGREAVHLDSNARFDSYDSSLGTYASQVVAGGHANVNGDVGSNGDISLDSNATIWGDAAAGPSHTTTITGNAQVSGSTVPATEPLQFPAINVPSYPSSGNWTVNGDTTLTAGNYAYADLRVNGNTTLTIRGPSNVVCTNLSVRSNAKILVDAAAGPVNFYVIDDFVLNSNAQMRATDYVPVNLRIYLLSDNVINPAVNVQLDEIELDSNTSVHGTILAPNAKVVLDSNFQMFGALMARSLEVNSNAQFHFDEDLVSATANDIPIYETLCWRELPYQD